MNTYLEYFVIILKKFNYIYHFILNIVSMLFFHARLFLHGSHCHRSGHYVHGQHCLHGRHCQQCHHGTHNLKWYN